MMMKKLLGFVSLLLLCHWGYAQTAITEGTWFNAEKDAKIQFYQKGDKLHGKIVWLQRGPDIRDDNNPDAKLQQRKLVGADILTGFDKDGDNSWADGKVYDPKNGKTYSAKITMKDPATLDLRGFIGTPLFGRTSTFTKAD